MKLTSHEENAVNSLDYVIRSLNLKITSKTLKEQLYLHPDFPSLLSLSEVLKKWNIPNVATRIYYKDLVNIPLPAIAFVEINEGIFAAIRKVTETHIEWLDTKKGWQKETLEEFASKWGNGNPILLLEPNENSEEKNYKKNRRSEVLDLLRIPFIFVTVVLGILLLGYSNRRLFDVQNWQYIALFITKSAGVIVSSLLLSQSLGLENSLTRTICGNGSKNDCNNILNSDAAKIFGWLKWSEIGFFYFAGGFIINLFVLLGNNALLTNVIILNILALPYTLYSIYYQYFIAKGWCKLCLIVQFVLWVEFIITLSVWQRIPFTFDIDSILPFTFCFTIPIALWVFIKKPLELQNLVMPLKRELYKSKFNPDYINSIFDKQQLIPPIFSGMETIKLGNLTSENVVTVVTNPMCGPCKRIHKEIEEMISNKHSDISFYFSFIFTGGEGAIEIAQRLFSLPEHLRGEAMNLWYSGKFKSIEEWTKEIPLGDIQKEASEQANIHLRWTEIAEVKSTPTLFLNNKELPLLYGINDIEDIIAALSTSVIYS